MKKLVPAGFILILAIGMAACNETVSKPPVQEELSQTEFESGSTENASIEEEKKSETIESTETVCEVPEEWKVAAVHPGRMEFGGWFSRQTVVPYFLKGDLDGERVFFGNSYKGEGTAENEFTICSDDYGFTAFPEWWKDGTVNEDMHACGNAGEYEMVFPNVYTAHDLLSGKTYLAGDYEVIMDSFCREAGFATQTATEDEADETEEVRLFFYEDGTGKLVQGEKETSLLRNQDGPAIFTITATDGSEFTGKCAMTWNAEGIVSIHIKELSVDLYPAER